MKTLEQGYRGFWVLLDLNWDRIFYVGAIALALIAGAYVGSI